MGGKKKKFIDKKKSATFQLFARDSSDTSHDPTPGSDSVFVRVDDNPFSLEMLGDDADEGCLDGNANSIFADAPDDDDDGGEDDRVFGKAQDVNGSAPSLSSDIRKRILELGFPDDGYNYLTHLREIKNTGGGALFYHNSKARLDELPHDVKAYDASRVHVSQLNGDPNDEYVYNASSKTIGVRVQRAADPEVTALLDEDSDLSRFGSDVEDLEEDFVVQANLQDEEEDFVVQENLKNEEGDGCIEKGFELIGVSDQAKNEFSDICNAEKRENSGVEKPRGCRPLDEEFDSLLLEEYGTNDNDHSDYGECDAEDEFSAGKLKKALGNHIRDDLDNGEIYRTPADVLNDKANPRTEEVELTSGAMRRCVEYAEEYQNKDEIEDEIVFEESSDESEAWDCDTIVSTYSNLDNHPGKIEVPGIIRKKKLAETVSEAMNANNYTITLRGKDKLPVDYLPRSKKNTIEKAVGGLSTDFHPRKHHGLESKEEKKERKSAVKEERREARRVKKEMKELYKGEAQRAQKAAAISGPSTLHFM